MFLFQGVHVKKSPVLKSCTGLCCVFPDCSSCSQIDMGSVTWILSCDIALTLLVCFSLLCLVLYQRKRGNRDSNNGKGQGHVTAAERGGGVALNFVTYPFVSLNFTTGRPKQAPSLAKRKMAEIPESPYQVNNRSTCYVMLLLCIHSLQMI